MATNEAYTLEIESAKLNENQLKMTIEVIADFDSLISSNYSRSNREDVMLSVQQNIIACVTEEYLEINKMRLIELIDVESIAKIIRTNIISKHV